MSYTKPQAIIHQRFTVATSPTVTTLRAVIVGPNTKLHRYSVVDEKELTSAGNFGVFAEVEDSYALIDFPGRKAGEIVERDSVKLHIDNALLTYYTDNSGSAVIDGNAANLTLSNQPNFYVDDNHPNVVTVGSETINGKEQLKVNLVEMAETPRSADVKRDVQIGDYVYLQGVTETENSAGCNLTEPFMARIIDFQYALEANTIGDPTVSVAIDTRATTAAASSTVLKVIASAVNEISDAGSDSDIFEVDSAYSYNGWAIGKPTITYIITPEVESYYNCRNKIKFNVKCSALGIADTTVWFSLTEGAFLPGSNGSVHIVLKENLSEGALTTFVNGTDKLRIVCTCAGRELTVGKLGSAANATCTDDIVINGNSTALNINDTLVLKCIKGGILRTTAVSTGDDSTIKLAAYTRYGKLIAQELKMTTLNNALSIGTSGISIKPQVSGSNTFFSLFTGDEIYIPLIAAKEVGVCGLALARSVPEELQSSDLSAEIIPLTVKLLSKENVEFAEGEGVEFEQTQIKVDTNLSYVSKTLLDMDGTALSMTVQPYEDNIDFNKMYVEYNTWVPTASYGLNFCESISGLDDIPGQLDPENPLKYSVYKALANSNGASVAYVAVREPYTFSSATEKIPNLESWQDALEILEGRDDVYTVVPTTTEQTVQNLVNTLVQNESSAEACRWKTALFSVAVPKKRLIVGVQDSFTSTDGEPVVAKFVENTSETGAGYNELRCTSGNSLFLERVQAGDIISVVGDYQTYVVDRVIADDALYTMPNNNTGPTSENAIEIWHTLNRADIIEYVRDYAQSFANRRIGLVWPDTIGEAGVNLPGYMLAAGLAGLKSGVEPIQGLTRLEVAGFDDFSRARPYMTETQMNLMAGSGVWIVQEDSDGTPSSRHAINTSTVDINYREEMMTRNMDSICKYLYQIIDRYIGVTIVNQETLDSIYSELHNACQYLVYIKQMNSYDTIRVKQHDLLSDRIEAFIVASLPYATNNVELYVTAERAELNEVSTETEQE